MCLFFLTIFVASCLLSLAHCQDEDLDNDLSNTDEGVGNQDDNDNGIIFYRRVPVRKIPGTNLQTGVYYKLGMKVFDSGRVTFSKPKTDSKWDYVQIISNTSSLPNYDVGGKNYHDIQWMFVPVMGVRHYYELHNRAATSKIAAWSRFEPADGSGHYIILDPSPMLHRRGDSLWKPVQGLSTDVCENTNGTCPTYYQLKILSQQQGVVTWEKNESDDGYNNIEVVAGGGDNDKLDKFKPGGDNYDDTLFTLEPTIDGDIKNSFSQK